MFETETMAQAQATLKKLDSVTRLLYGEIEGLNSKVYEFRPAPTEWSIKEIVCHLATVDDIFYERCQRMIFEDEPFLRGFNPEELALDKGYARQIWDEAVQEWQQNRQRNIQFYRELSVLNWLKGAFHQERGHINVIDVAISLVSQSELLLEQIRNNKNLAK